MDPAKKSQASAWLFHLEAFHRSFTSLEGLSSQPYKQVKTAALARALCSFL